MWTAFLFIFLFIALFLIHASDDTRKATFWLVGIVVGVVAGLILLGIYYPLALNYLFAAFMLIAVVVTVYDFGRRVWLWSRRDG
jgi:hypothetical protein